MAYQWCGRSSTRDRELSSSDKLVTGVSAIHSWRTWIENGICSNQVMRTCDSRSAPFRCRRGKNRGPEEQVAAITFRRRAGLRWGRFRVLLRGRCCGRSLPARTAECGRRSGGCLRWDVRLAPCRGRSSLAAWHFWRNRKREAAGCAAAPSLRPGWDRPANLRDGILGVKIAWGIRRWL